MQPSPGTACAGMRARATAAFASTVIVSFPKCTRSVAGGRTGGCSANPAVANQASVDKHVNGIAIELLDFGFGNEAVSAQLAKRFFFLLDQIFADGACTKRKSAGVTLLLFPPPRRRLRQANSLERLQRGH